MDSSKRKGRFSLERLETREAPAHLGQIVELPYAAAPVAQVALTSPADLGQGVGASIKIDSQSLVNVKLDSSGSADVKLDPSQGGSTQSDHESALKVQFQDFHFTRTVSKHSPTLNLSSDAGDALKVQFQDFHFTQTVSKHTPTLNLMPDAVSALNVQSQDVQAMKITLTDVLV